MYVCVFTHTHTEEDVCYGIYRWTSTCFCDRFIPLDERRAEKMQNGAASDYLPPPPPDPPGSRVLSPLSEISMVSVVLLCTSYYTESGKGKGKGGGVSVRYRKERGKLKHCLLIHLHTLTYTHIHLSCGEVLWGRGHEALRLRRVWYVSDALGVCQSNGQRQG